jgi:anti-anti-sigma regulatory factor
MQITELSSTLGTRLQLSGSLGPAEAAELKERLLAQLESRTAVQLDLAGVEEMSLASLQLVTSARRTFRKQGIELAVVDSASSVWQSLAVAAAFPDMESEI